MSLVRVSTLGSISISGATGPELPSRGKLIALLVYLARRSNGGVRREELADLFWGDKPEVLARQSLRHALMRLRRAVGDDVLVVTAEHVRVAADYIELDASRFEQCVAASDFAAAVTLWRGDFLDGFEDAGGEAWRAWLEAEREALRRRLAYALATLIDAAESSADWESASRWAEQWCAALPLDEHAAVRWIQTLRLAGRHADALAAHARVTRRLREELGVTPGVALARMGDELVRVAQTPARGAAGAAMPNAPDLIGRSTAFSALVNAWEDVRAGAGCVVSLEGAEGFGKTRLIEEFLRWQRAQQQRALVLHARAFESDRDVPWSTARELLAELRTAPGLSGAPDSALAEVAELVPALADRFRKLPQPAGTPDARARALTQVLCDVAAELPVLLVIDDFTSADAASLRLALALARRPPAGVLLVFAVRPNGQDTSAHERELRAAPNCRRVRLEPLTAAETEALIASMLAARADVRRVLAQRIHARTRGCPLHIVESIHALAEKGVLYVGASGEWEINETLAERPPARFRRRTAVVLATLVLVTSLGLLALREKQPAHLPVLAVGEIVDESIRDSSAAPFPLRDLLATRLATLPSLPVISPERMHELRAQHADASLESSTLRAARRAGADEILQGTMLRSRTGDFRLELRRVHLESGAVTGAYSITASDPLELIDAATERIASGFGVPVLRGAPGTPASLVAYRLYEEGLRTYYQGDGAAAHRFFNAALDEDSTFAMAAFYDYASQHMAGLLDARSDAQLARVVKLAVHAPPRESLLIRALWAAHVHAPERLALAETLAIRYPHEPEGHLLLAQAKYSAGDHLGSIPHYRKVVDMDTAGTHDAALPCRACDALAGMTSAYSLADSLPAAERAARAWTRLQPTAGRAWVYLATTLEYQERFADAVTVRRNAMALRPGDRVDIVYPARVEVRQGRYERADAMLRERMREGSAAVAREAAWYLIISLREQGRLREALGVALDSHDSLSQAVVRLEMGDGRAAAGFFEREAAKLREDTVVPRHGARIWKWAHVATARAIANDTAALRVIADTIAVLGRYTAAARNIRLQHYPLGLLYAARGDQQAALRAFERSVNSLTNGYGRLNLELARTLIAQDQPRRAVAVLRAGLRGPVDAGNYYNTHTEFRALLGEAYEAAAMPDSALHMYERVLSAWRRADPSFDSRRARIQQRVDQLARQNPRSAALVRR